ncbi:MAG: serine/threonine-protein kinase [Planctomycetota bacterium]
MSGDVVWSQYEVGDLIGVGTVGSIYRATDRNDGKTVALKRLHPGVSSDPLIRSRFRREMMILARLDHPNIIRYFGGGEDPEGGLFYAMECVDGGTVKDLLDRGGPMRWPVVVELTRQICSALQCAHNHGVIHRDLKPGNLFLTRDGELKLGDFGIARDNTETDLTGTGMTVGTHAYMAPEQITGDLSISGKADLYALGCCVYEMLVGRKVFSGDHFAELFEKHLRAKPPHVRDSIPNCPEQLDQIVVQLLAKSPEDRPFNARTVQGVMIALETRGDLSGGDNTGDVAASAVASMGQASMGREWLVQRIERSHQGGEAREISWTQWCILAGFVIAAITAIALLR